MQDLLVNYGISGAQILSVVGAVIIVLFAIYHLITDLISTPQEAMKRVVGIAVFAGFLLLMYVMASDEISNTFAKAKYADVTPSNMKLITAGLGTAMWLSAIALGSWIIMEIGNLFR
ncbi:MAG: hypothetical protein ACPG5B_10040 [Chitinophagales bacterium]